MTTPLLQPNAIDYLTLLRAQFPPVAGATVDILPILWRAHQAASSRGGQELQYLYTRRDCLDGLLTGQYSTSIKYEEAGVVEDHGGIFKNLSDIRAMAHAEVLRLEGIGRASRGSVVSQMAATAPIERDSVVQFDPNSRSTRGDPLRPNPFRKG